MRSYFFKNLTMFLTLILSYYLISTVLFGNFYRDGGDVAFQNAFGIILTALIMTVFEMLFVYTNYHYAMNNSMNDKLSESARRNASNYVKMRLDDGADIEDIRRDGDSLKNVLDIFHSVPLSETRKIDSQNKSVDYSIFILIIFLFLLLLLIRKTAHTYGYKITTVTIANSIISSLCLIIFFGYFYFNVSSEYDMTPDHPSEILEMIKESLDKPVNTQDELDYNYLNDAKKINIKPLVIIITAIIVVKTMNIRL